MTVMTGGRLPNEIRQRGLRLTPQRELVLAAVRELGHSTPEEISAHVRKTHPGINLSTVYRNLETLQKAGFVVHSHLGHGGATFHAADEASHLHLVCSECGKVSEADLSIASEFTSMLTLDYGFKTDITHFAIHGKCAECDAK